MVFCKPTPIMDVHYFDTILTTGYLIVTVIFILYTCRIYPFYSTFLHQIFAFFQNLVQKIRTLTYFWIICCSIHINKIANLPRRHSDNKPGKSARFRISVAAVCVGVHHFVSLISISIGGNCFINFILPMRILFL